MENNEPFVITSEANRRDARMSIINQIESLRNELAKLNAEQKAIEQQCSDVETWKRTELSEVYRKRFDRSRACEYTNKIEVEYREKKSPLLVQLRAIEERKHAIKSRLSEKQKDNSKSHDDILLRIESLLVRICNKLEA